MKTLDVGIPMLQTNFKVRAIEHDSSTKYSCAQNQLAKDYYGAQ